ncbi:MAG: DUF192 domain-containing protein [Parcubacteria group bacterium]|jgi:hypothetical protein
MAIKNKIIISFFILAIVALLALVFLRVKKQEVWIKNQKFTVEIADTDIEMQAGLSGREKLCEKCGMLFVFSRKGRYGFWMKGMRFNLDMIWIDGNSIAYIAKDVPYDSKETISPETMADKVLELDAGMADELNIEIGDEINF